MEYTTSRDHTGDEEVVEKSVRRVDVRDGRAAYSPSAEDFPAYAYDHSPPTPPGQWSHTSRTPLGDVHAPIVISDNSPHGVMSPSVGTSSSSANFPSIPEPSLHPQLQQDHLQSLARQMCWHQHMKEIELQYNNREWMKQAKLGPYNLSVLASSNQAETTSPSKRATPNIEQPRTGGPENFLQQQEQVPTQRQAVSAHTKAHPSTQQQRQGTSPAPQRASTIRQIDSIPRGQSHSIEQLERSRHQNQSDRPFRCLTTTPAPRTTLAVPPSNRHVIGCPPNDVLARRNHTSTDIHVNQHRESLVASRSSGNTPSSSHFKNNQLLATSNTEMNAPILEENLSDNETGFAYADVPEETSFEERDPRQLSLEQVGIKIGRSLPNKTTKPRISRNPSQAFSSQSKRSAEDYSFEIVPPPTKMQRTIRVPNENNRSVGKARLLLPHTSNSGLSTKTCEESQDVPALLSDWDFDMQRNAPSRSVSANLMPQSSRSHRGRSANMLVEHLEEDNLQDPNLRSTQTTESPLQVPSQHHGNEPVYMILQNQLRQKQSEIDALQKSYDDLTKRSVKDSSKGSAPPWLTVHLVRYEDSHRLYEGCPQWIWTGGQYRIEGLHPILRLDKFVQKRKSTGASFLVIHSYDFSKLQDCESADHQDAELVNKRRTNIQVQFLNEVLAKPFDTLLEQNENLKMNVKYADSLDLCGDMLSETGESFPMVDNMVKIFYHFRQLLMEAPEKFENAERQALNDLVNFLIAEFGEKHSAIRKSIAEGFVTPTTLPYLFKQGDTIVFCENKRVWGAKFISFVEGPEPEICILAESYGFDGNFHLLKKKYKSQLPSSLQKKQPTAINSLPCYPISFADAEVRERLRKRGHTYWKCRRSAYVAYNGPNTKQGTNYKNTRFLIDVRTYHSMHPPGPAVTRRYEQTLIDKVSSEDEPPAELVFMVPETIFGFDIQEKKWINIEVDDICDIQWNKNAFETLVIEEESKELVKALVSNKINADKATDAFKGKGNGLTLLLHGGPGTGKTLTAESVAEISEKPLYRVTCGDIGTEPREVEQYLESVFHLGKIWDCVVLLDEADVFLEQRSLADLTRNALVTVFLRALEYYDGILILTTNRVGTFDEAFRSRIQLALHYNKLDRAQREHIWTNFLDRLKELGEDFKEAEIRGKIKVLAEYELNGRQIRNALTTARQLALSRKTALGLEHLKHSIKVSTQFDKFLQDACNPYYELARGKTWFP